MFYQLLLTQNVQIWIVFLLYILNLNKFWIAISFPLSQINYHENKQMVSCVFNLKYLSQNLVKLHIGVLKTLGPADSKSVPGFKDWPRFGGVIDQNKISNSFENYCMLQQNDIRRDQGVPNYQCMSGVSNWITIQLVLSNVKYLRRNL